MSQETRPGELPRAKRSEALVTLGDLVKVGVACVSLAGGGVLASYVQLQRTADNVDQIRTDLRDIKAVQGNQQSQLISIAQDQAVQTYRLNAMEKQR